MQLEYTAPGYVRDAVATLGRTEDVKFSPNNNRLAVASFSRDEIFIFEIRMGAAQCGKKITVTDATRISSSFLQKPHGVDFIDDETIIVANRQGDVTIFKLPSAGGGDCHELVPLEIIRCGDVLNTPGSVAIAKKDEHACEALVCNNYDNKVTKHMIPHGVNFSVQSSEVLLQKRLAVPDGVSVSGSWIAVSNHDTHSVLLYKNSGSLNPSSEPDGILRFAHYPHGVRFTSDGCFILVSDAGAPYVNIYMKDAVEWRGVRSPHKSFRVLSDEDFLIGRHSVDTGGVKGIDIDHSMNILVTTCEVQPLAFFYVAEILQWIAVVYKGEAYGSSDIGEVPDASHVSHCQAQRAIEIKYELERYDEAAEQMAHSTDLLMNSLSWRITAPLRWLKKVGHIR